MMNLGEIIRSIRTQRNISMNELANMIGTSQSALSMIENGRRTPNLTTLNRIAEALGISEKELNELKHLRNEIAHGKDKNESIRVSERSKKRVDPDIMIEFFPGYKTGIEIKTVGSSPAIPTNIMSALIENAIKEVLIHEKRTVRDIVKHQVMHVSDIFRNEDI